MSVKYCMISWCRFAHSHCTAGHLCGTCGKKGHGQVECGDPSKISALSGFPQSLPESERCPVRGCVDKTIHTLAGHRCDLCGDHGHPVSDCRLRPLVYIPHTNDPPGGHPRTCPVCRVLTPMDAKKVFGFKLSCPVCLEETDDPRVLACGHGLCSGCYGEYYKVLHTVNGMDMGPHQETVVRIVEKFKQYDQTNQTDTKVWTCTFAGMGCSFYARRLSRQSRIEFFFMHSDSWGQYGPGTDDRPLLAQFLYMCDEI